MGKPQRRFGKEFEAEAVRLVETSGRTQSEIAENLGEHWGVNADVASEAIEKELTETEEKTLKDLNEFNFDDL